MLHYFRYFQISALLDHLSKLFELRNEPKSKELRAVGCREQFYNAVAAELEPEMAKLGAVKATRVKRIAA